MITMIKTALASAAVLTLAACAVQPARHLGLPAAVGTLAPATWRVAATQDTIDAGPWWSQFGDTTLHRLVQTVLDGNLDAQAAQQRIEVAQAEAAQRHAALLPQLDAGALAAHARQITPPPLGYVDSAGIGVTVTWDLDVFGGERLAVLAAQAQVAGRTWAFHELRLALAARTATAYIDLRWAQTEQQILADNAQISRRALQLTQDRLRFGLSTRLDVERAQSQLQDVLARMPVVDTQIQHQLNLIAVLSGRTPESVDGLVLSDARAVPVPSQHVPQTLPSEALLQRPDVRAAYARVEQRAAEVGAARAERYPKFRLSLSDGLLAASWVNTPTLNDNLFSAALNATSPIFNAGRITAHIDASESRMRESQLALEQAMLNALKEIEDSRSDLVSDAAQVERLRAARDASKHAVTLSTQLYQGGAANFLDVIDAQRIYLRDAQALNQAHRTHAQAAVALYRALGGAWEVPTETAAAPFDGRRD
jgi:NodT family efflux transporter outer membrane factor (OMF) lipoprotein